jgi:hypothetical protein
MQLDLDPHILLQDVVWIFDGEPYATIYDFEEAIIQTQIEISGHDENWCSEQIFCSEHLVRVFFSACSDNGDIQYEIEMKSHHSHGFSNLDFMFKLHNQIVPILRNDSHNFFEGIAFDASWQEPGKAVSYMVLLGS